MVTILEFNSRSVPCALVLRHQARHEPVQTRDTCTARKAESDVAGRRSSHAEEAGCWHCYDVVLLPCFRSHIRSQTFVPLLAPCLPLATVVYCPSQDCSIPPQCLAAIVELVAKLPATMKKAVKGLLSILCFVACCPYVYSFRSGCATRANY